MWTRRALSGWGLAHSKGWRRTLADWPGKDNEGEGLEGIRVEMSPEEERRLHSDLQDQMGGTVNSFEDLSLQEQKALSGDLHAMARLGISHLHGVEGLLPPNPDRGLELLYAAGLKGHGGAYNAIGKYWSIEGYQRKAFPWFEKAAALGDASAHWELGFRLENGKGVRADPLEVRPSTGNRFISSHRT